MQHKIDSSFLPHQYNLLYFSKIYITICIIFRLWTSMFSGMERIRGKFPFVRQFNIPCRHHQLCSVGDSRDVRYMLRHFFFFLLYLGQGHTLCKEGGRVVWALWVFVLITHIKSILHLVDSLELALQDTLIRHLGFHYFFQEGRKWRKLMGK